MNKKIITTSAASLVLAAMPVVGAFAADTTSLDETVTVTVSESCTFVGTTAANPSETITPGASNDAIAGTKFSISCNDAGGWSLSAKGAGAEGHVADLVNGDNYITSLNGTLDASDETSNWAFKVAAGSGASAVGSYNNFSQVPTTETKIAEDSAASVKATVDVTYGVAVSAKQAPGTYTGKVTYTLTHPDAG